MLVTGNIRCYSPGNSKTSRKVATLSMPGETGNNGGSVVWHPVLKKYYASFAGNASYPMGVFDPTGKLISPEDIETMFDTRGLCGIIHQKDRSKWVC